MTGPQDDPTVEQPMVTPTVSTDPARSRWHWSALPDHLGRARTSTVVLGVLFLAIGTLYLNVRPATTDPTPASDTGSVVQDSTPDTTAPPATVPETTTAPETSTEEVPTTTESTETTPTTGPTDETTPTGSTETVEPTDTLPTLTPPTEPNTTASSPTP
jgi:hypothetical protein